MNHEITCSWKGAMGFEALANGHKVLMDAEDSFGGHDSGPRPKPLLLVALAGCSGMDVVSLLQKMREPLSWYDMKVSGDLSEDHPKIYTRIKISYLFKASDGMKPESVEKAVRLSQDKYCGVSALFRLAVPVDWEIIYV
jgi:putative redox protein